MRAWKQVLVAGLLLQAAAGLRAEGIATIQVKGPIGPATASYVARGDTHVAAERKGRVPGRATRHARRLARFDQGEFVETFYASPVPTVVYVAPSGANAGSAGVFITLAADVAAMAPDTSIGAAHPGFHGRRRRAKKP